MSNNLTPQIQKSFHLAILRKEAEKLRTSDQWREAGQVRDHYADLYKQADQEFRGQYHTRVEMAAKRLIDQAASKKKDFKHRWFGGDPFDKAAILRQAQREVRAHHRIEIDTIEKRETAALEDVLARAGKLNAMRGQAKEQFGSATDRRREPFESNVVDFSKEALRQRNSKRDSNPNRDGPVGPSRS